MLDVVSLTSYLISCRPEHYESVQELRPYVKGMEGFRPRWRLLTSILCSTRIRQDMALVCTYSESIPPRTLIRLCAEMTYNKYWKRVFPALRPLRTRNITIPNGFGNSRKIKMHPRQDVHSLG